MMLNDLPPEVSAMGQMHFEGNIVPEMWYSNIKFENGKVDLISITLLSEICYWYRPSYIRDEMTGRVICIKKKFKADLLQKSKKALAEKFGFTERQVKDSLERLEASGYIFRDYRTVVNASGVKMPNILFIKIFPEKIQEVTFQGFPTYDVQTSDTRRSNVTYMTFQRQPHLYSTKTTTEITKNNTPPTPENGEAAIAAVSEIHSKNLRDYSEDEREPSKFEQKQPSNSKNSQKDDKCSVKQKNSTQAKYERFGEFVKFKTGEYETFCEKYSKEMIDSLIEEMNDYCAASKPKGYADYAAAMRQWISRRKTNPSANVVDKSKCELNKKIAQKIENTLDQVPSNKKKVIFAALSEGVEISESPYKKPLFIKYSENGFEEQLKNALDKYDLLKFIKK